MRYVYILISALIVFNSCKSKSTEDIDYFENEYTIVDYDSIYSDKDDYLGRVRNIEIVDGTIITENAQGDYIFSFIDPLKGELIAQWGRIGRGPSEFIQIGSGFSIWKSQLVFLDAMKKEINYVPLSNILDGTEVDINSEPYPYINDFRPSQIVISADKKIAIGAFHEGRFGILDAENNIITCPYDYPFQFKEIQGIYRGSIFQSKIRTNEKMNRFVISTNYSDNFEIFEVKSSGIDRIYKSPTNEIPEIHEKPRRGVSHTVDYDMSIAGIVTIATSEDLIYLIYSSENYNEFVDSGHSSNEILCFDWDGNKVKKYILPFAIDNFCVDENYIYGVKDDVEATVIYRFTLS